MRPTPRHDLKDLLRTPLAEFMDQLPVGFWIQDGEGRVVMANRALLQSLGVEEPGEVDLGEDPAPGGATSEEPYALRLKGKDDREVELLIHPLPTLSSKELRAVLAVEKPRNGASSTKLTRREQEIVEGLVAGKSVREIAEGSGISTNTVRNHIKSIYRKLGVHSRTDLVRLFLGRS